MVTKKIKFFAALAVASLVGLTSCSNNNEVTEGIDNGKEKSVFLKIEQPKRDHQQKCGDLYQILIFVFYK